MASLLAPLAVASAFASACSGARSAPEPSPVSFTVTLSIPLVEGNVRALVVNDAAGAMVGAVMSVTSDSITVAVPRDGSLTLRESNLERTVLRTWVAPPSATIEVAPLLPTPAEPPKVATATTWDVSLSGGPPGTAVYQVLASCNLNMSTSSAGIAVSDSGCPLYTQTSVVGVARDVSGLPLAWGATSGVSAVPGVTVPFPMALEYAAPELVVTLEGLPAGAVIGSAATMVAVPGIPPFVHRASFEALGSPASLSVPALGGGAWPETMVASVNASGMAWTKVARVLADMTLDLNQFPALSALVFSPAQAGAPPRWSFATDGAFGTAGAWLRVGPGPDLIVWLRADATGFSLPELPAEWITAGTMAGSESVLVVTDAAELNYTGFLSQDYDPDPTSVPFERRVAEGRFETFLAAPRPSSTIVVLEALP